MSDENKDAGTWIGVGISVAMLLLSFVACIVTGFAAAQMRESDSVALSYLTVPFIVAGLVAWLPALLARKKGMGMAVGAPIGCGCVSGIGAGIALAIFYIVLWPSL